MVQEKFLQERRRDLKWIEPQKCKTMWKPHLSRGDNKLIVCLRDQNNLFTSYKWKHDHSTLPNELRALLAVLTLRFQEILNL